MKDIVTVNVRIRSRSTEDGRSILFRQHRGSLAESMKAVAIFANDEDLFNHIKDILNIEVRWDQIKVDPYVFDDRLNWDTYIVMVESYGTIGFTNRPWGA